MAESFGNLIGGSWVPAKTGRTLDDRNPADSRDLIGRFPDSGPDDVSAAVAAARSAFPAWRALPAPKRGEILYRAAQILVDRKEELARAMTREMGKVLAETRGDVQEAIDMTYYMAGEGRRQFGQTTPSELRDKFQLSVRMPVGVAGLVTPWNFPMAIPSWKMMPALILGNTVVVKPAPDTPAATVHLAHVLEEAGIPPGVVNVVTGGAEAGAALVAHPDVGIVSFTGSTATGRTVSETCASAFKHCHLEMGGKNVIIVMDDARIDLAVDGALWGGFGTTGQRCTAASRVVVHAKVLREFTERFVEQARALRVGDGSDPATEMGPLVSAAQLRRVESYVSIGKAEGATLLCGGNALRDSERQFGHFHEPTVFGDVSPSMRVAQEEIFGPVVCLIPCGSFEEAVGIANGVDYGLSAAIYTQDVNKAFAAMRDLYTGIVYVNAPTIGAETHLPFGGTKRTGNGHREACVQALDVFSEWKSIYVDFSGTLQRAQIDA
jgi:acyl-CoA reductase-like NAD-dependent aldehyde dehydrogenase